MAAIIPPLVFGFAAGLAFASLYRDATAILPAYRALVRQIES